MTPLQIAATALMDAMVQTDFTCRLGEQLDALEKALEAEQAQDSKVDALVKRNIGFLYEELRKATDGGSESMTHDDALKQIAYWQDKEQAQAVEPVATVQCINGVTVGYLDVMQPVGTKLFTHSATPATGARAELIEKLRWAGAVGGNETCTQAADMLEADAQGLINFDTWQKNPYTVAMHKSIAEDYVPKQAQQVAVPPGYALVPTEALLDIKSRVNTLATLSLKSERYSVGREIKQSIADMLAAPQPPQGDKP